MATFEFTNIVANSDDLQGLSAGLYWLHFKKGSNGQTIITMQFPGRNYPKNIYGMAIFEFGQNLIKTKEKEGLNCKFTTPQLLEGAKCKINHTMLISGSSYPKNIYGMPPRWIGMFKQI